MGMFTRFTFSRVRSFLLVLFGSGGGGNPSVPFIKKKHCVDDSLWSLKG